MLLRVPVPLRPLSLWMPIPPVFVIVIVPSLVVVPEPVLLFSIPMPPVFCILISPVEVLISEWRFTMPKTGESVIVINPELVRVPEEFIRMPSPAPDFVIVLLLVSMPRLSIAMLLTAFDSVIVPLLVIVLPALLKMPIPPAVFETVICPPEMIVMRPLLSRPRSVVEGPEFDVVICPPESMVMIPLLMRPLPPAGLSIDSVVPVGIISSSEAGIELPIVSIVHVLPNHDPPYVGHVPELSVTDAACASWAAKVDNVKIKRVKIER